MLEWFGICCCSTFVSCICSLIASTLCLSPGKAHLRTNMTKASKNKKANEIRVDKRKGTNGRSSRETCLPCTRLLSEHSYMHSPQPYPRGPHSPDMIYLAKQGFLGPTPSLCPPQCPSVWNGPLGSLPYSSNPPIQSNECRNTSMEREIRKCIDEYNTVYKQINELITKKTMHVDGKKSNNAQQTHTKPSASGGVTFSATTGILDETRTSGTRHQRSLKRRNMESVMKKTRKSSHKTNNENAMQKHGKKEKDIKKKKNIKCGQRSQLSHKGNAKQASIKQESPYYYELKSMEPVNRQATVKPTWGVWNQRLQKTVKKICERTKGGDGGRCCTCNDEEITSFCS